MEEFAGLFRKYRLKAELETLAAVAAAFVEKGIVYEDSMFSHWQTGRRLPRTRKILLVLIHILIERQAITTVQEVNQLFEAAGQGYLTDREQHYVQSLLCR
jgi:hypothetical protein